MELKLVGVGEHMPVGDGESTEAAEQNTLVRRPPASPRDENGAPNRLLAGG